jgi:Ni/Co efflux regulator RcnB
MSEENVEVVNTLFAAFARRDFEAAAGVLDPSVEVRPAIVGGPEGVVYRGLDGMRRFWADIDAAWAEFRIAPEEFRELDGEILVLDAPSLAAGKAASSSTRRRHGSRDCVRARSWASKASATRRTPSKPPGCGNRRCRRRTSRWCVGSTKPQRDATPTRCSHYTTGTWSGIGLASAACSEGRLLPWA